MNNETQHGYLVVADISGYTSYLAGTELSHARDILTELLELIVQRFKPLLNIVQLEGDAVFAHVPKTKILRDETLLEMMESTYLAFRDRVEGIRRRTTCQCNACKAIPTLDLKFIVHFGEYLPQNVSGITELVGSDVNLVHRLLKNHVAETTGWKAYVLFTEAGLTQLNVKLENLHAQNESYEHLGEVKTYSLNLRARYEELVQARRVFISPEDADLMITRTVHASPVIVWEWLNDTQKRLQWEGKEIRPVIRPGGRTGAGAQNHCVHGKNVSVETVLDWHPFESFTLGGSTGVVSYRLEEVADETRINIYSKIKMPLPRWLTRPLAKFIVKLANLEEPFDTLVKLIEEE
jgi:Protein of unknown function (DUF2652)/Polyketide cyclase / dehydrase and lipid transport